MKRTRLGILLLALGWSCLPLTFVFRTYAPALLGVLLVGAALGVRPPAPSIRVSRELPERAVAGEPFDVRAEAQDASGAPLFLDEELPQGVRVLEREAHAARGRATLRLRVVADEPGALRWKGLRVRYQDAWGLLEDETRIGLVALTQVQSATDVLAAGQRAGERSAERRVQRIHGLDVETEIERLRDHQPGDRFRDIDWAHTSVLGRLVVRELRRESSPPLVILLHASRSMRRRRRRSKLSSATRAALALLAAAERKGIDVGLIAWSERGVEARLPPGRRVATGALQQLAALPEALPFEPSAQPASETERPLLPEERAFLQAASAFVPTAGATPTEAALGALARMMTRPAIVIAFLDLEETPRAATVVLARLRHHGHRAVFVAPASGAHHYARSEVDDAALAQLTQWQENRQEAANVTARQGAPFVVLYPDLSEKLVREMIAYAR